MRMLTTKLVLVAGSALAAGIMASRMPFEYLPGNTIDTSEWTPCKFAEHLRMRGETLYVVPGAMNGSCHDSIYLTEDPGATWQSMQNKWAGIQRIDHWRGTVLVRCVHPEIGEVENEDPNQCRIGRFVLFGDDVIIRRIREAFRQ